MKVAVIGCGGWGSRVARRISHGIDGLTLDAVFDDFEPHAEALAVELGCAAPGHLGDYLADEQPGGVVVATPPTERKLLVAQLAAAGVPRIRVEKPLAVDAREAADLAELCKRAGAQLTVGFNLLHHPAYEVLFGVLERLQYHSSSARYALRVGDRPRHRAHPMLDIGIHAASVFAYLGIEDPSITALHVDGGSARTTCIGDVVVDEARGMVSSPLGTVRINNQPDDLGRCLQAWANGTHRGTPEVAIRAHQIIDRHIQQEANAA